MANTIVRDTLQSIYDQHGKLTPGLVVDEARPATHPLHDRFEWDDSVAAEKHRQSQAAALIRSVRVLVPQKDQTVTSVRAYLPTPTNGYQKVDALIVDERQVLIAQMIRDVSALKNKYRHLTEFWELLAEEAQNHNAA